MNLKQSTNHIIMVRPKHFNYNEETAKNNYFQKKEEKLSLSQTQEKVIKEFEAFIKQLRKKKINVTVFDDKDDTVTTDSIFPNNWVSFHKDGKIVLYPMFSKNRRKERRKDIIDSLKKEGFCINETIDLTSYEENSLFLEGTGSMVLDRKNKICYAAISERTSEAVLNQFCKKAKYKPIIFHAYQTVFKERKEIYHTNVIMCVADKYSIICLDSIDKTLEREKVINSLINTDKEIIEISEEQCNNFSGNSLQIENINGDKYLIMSQKAYKALNKKQKGKILSYNEIIYSDLSTIEKLGGGSARCMIAENFLEKK